jgi:biotin carboxyl carrier protein
VHATSGAIGEFYELSGGGGGPLGFPVGDAGQVWPLAREGGDGIVGRRQPFEGGTVYAGATNRPVIVPAAVARYLDRRGAGSSPGFPVSPQLAAAGSPHGTSGHLQRFEGFADYPEDIASRWSTAERPGGATVYSSQRHGVYCVTGEIGFLFERLGGTGGWLGFPTSDETVRATMPGPPRSSVQDFEGGLIFRKDGQEAIAVSVEVLRYLAEQSLERELGFPVTAAQPLRADDATTIQFFEGGLVTSQDGVLRAWLPPQAQAQPPPVPATEPPEPPPLTGPARLAVTMPRLGDDVTVGTVTRWLKRVGERVVLDEPLLEVSTDKVDVEIPSPAAGTVVSILADNDETVAVGAALAIIERDQA